MGNIFERIRFAVLLGIEGFCVFSNVLKCEGKGRRSERLLYNELGDLDCRVSGRTFFRPKRQYRTSPWRYIFLLVGDGATDSVPGFPAIGDTENARRLIGVWCEISATSLICNDLWRVRDVLS
jgi:hypothetical protein